MGCYTLALAWRDRTSRWIPLCSWMLMGASAGGGSAKRSPISPPPNKFWRASAKRATYRTRGLKPARNEKEERLGDSPGGGDRRPGQHFIGGEEPATMAVHFFQCGLRFCVVEMLNGIAHEVH